MQHRRPHWRSWWCRFATATVAATTLATTAGSPIWGGDSQSPFSWMAGPSLPQDQAAVAPGVPQVQQRIARTQPPISQVPHPVPLTPHDRYGSSAWSPEYGTMQRSALVPQTQQGVSPWQTQGGTMQGGPVLNGPGFVPPQQTQPKQPVTLPPTPSQGDLPWADAATLPGEVAPAVLHPGAAVPGIGLPLTAPHTTAPPPMAPRFSTPGVLPWQRAKASAAASNTTPPAAAQQTVVVPSQMEAKVAGPLAITPPTGNDTVAGEPTPALPTPAFPTPAQPNITPPTVTDPTPAEPVVPEPTLAEPTPAQPQLPEPTLAEPAVTQSTPSQAAPTQIAPTQTAPDQTAPVQTAPPTDVSAVGSLALSPQVYDQVSRQAVQHITKGFELADRRMFYAARREFHRALEVIAQALDLHEPTPRHTTALVNGMRAMDEAADFQNLALDVDRDVREIAASHRTPVLQTVAEPLSPLAAAQQYYAYAQEQLALAVKPLQAGSAALSALGKLHDELAREETTFVENPLARVKVFHQAALLVDQNNWQAANELAVFLARSGNYEEARGWLQHSVAVSPQPENWHNLACLHLALGEQQQAQFAMAQARRLAGIDSSGEPASITSKVDVQWVDPQQFADVGANLPLESMPPGGAAPQAPSPNGQTAQNTAAAKGTEKAPATAAHPASAPTAPRTWNWFPWKR